MRRGEVLGLRWSDLDLGTGIAHLSQTLSDNGNFETPKSHRSRTFHLPDFLISRLKSHRKD
jgi:integrase